MNAVTNVLKDLFGSKKFLVTFANLIFLLLVAFVPSLEPMEDYLVELIIVSFGYLVGQGIADNGKEAEKIKNGG